MDLMISWGVFIGLTTVIIYSHGKEKPTRDEPAHRRGRALPRNRVARRLALYTSTDWVLLIGAVAFLTSAISGTAEVLL